MIWISLPGSQSLKCVDRFDMVDSENPDVPFWDILKAILKASVYDIKTLVERLEMIAVALRGTANTDYGFFLCFFQAHLSSPVAERHFFDSVWPVVVKLALELPELFPGCLLPSLSEDNPQIVLSRRQTACLVAHQFLCTLPQLPWDTDSFTDFHIWYSSDARHTLATRAYLHSLFAYFERLADDECSPLTTPKEEWPIVFTLRTSKENEDKGNLASFAAESNLTSLNLTFLLQPSANPSLLGLPNGACVISANKNIGFGQTGTQEELHVGSSPESCPAVLMTPPLKDSQVLVVQGPEAMISMKGHGREARLDTILAPDYDSKSYSRSKWVHRTMLFMDALELDLYDSSAILPDLLPGNIDRELVKAYTAFSSHNSAPSDSATQKNYTEIFTGLWGCGAFGGNREVKSIIQWCAASMANVSLNFVCAGDSQADFAKALNDFVENCRTKGWKVKDVLDILRAWEPGQDGKPGSAFAHIKKALDK